MVFCWFLGAKLVFMGEMGFVCYFKEFYGYYMERGERGWIEIDAIEGIDAIERDRCYRKG